MRISTALVVILAAMGGLACADGTSSTLAVTPTATPKPTPRVPLLSLQVIRTLPHDSTSFTQGLLLDKGKFLESTGLYKKSSLRRVDPTTGNVENEVTLPDEIFAEGLALANGQLIQITWREHKAFTYDAETMAQTGEFDYEGEGWGITFDGTHLIMSDGSDKLTFREPQTFLPLRTINVRLEDRPIGNLNELEYAQGFVFANVWQQDVIVKVDPKDGKVVAAINASGLLTPEERKKTDVLNGIAFDPTSGNLFVTGKLWPKIFEVKLVESGKR